MGAAVAALFDWMGADVRGDLGEIRFANLCTIRDRRVAHLVIAGARGPVTVLIMPGEDIHRSVVVEDGSRRGRIAPYGTGALAVVSERPQPLGRIEERLRSTLQWRAAAGRKSGNSV